MTGTFLTTGILLVSAGCFLQKKPTVQVPVASRPAPVAAKPAAAPPAPVPVAPAPVAETPTQTAPAPAQPPPADTPKPSPFPSATKPPAPVKPAPVAPVPAPSLGAILSADQKQKLDGAYQADLRAANAVLNSLSGRALTPEQSDTANRARAFIRQAQQYHSRDLTTAAELARRAKVLAQDLAGAHK